MATATPAGVDNTAAQINRTVETLISQARAAMADIADASQARIDELVVALA